MTPRRFIERPMASVSSVVAARYVPGESLDDLLEVARMEHPDAGIVEVPEFEIAIVRSWKIPDNHPAYVDYTTVGKGCYLAYSRTYDLLFCSAERDFLDSYVEP